MFTIIILTSFPVIYKTIYKCLFLLWILKPSGNFLIHVNEGSYQPSKELLLKFYGYYKQATIGPNNQPKPSFWDVVNRAKWQAWDNLGNMSKEKAMEEYVDELKKVYLLISTIYIYVYVLYIMYLYYYVKNDFIFWLYLSNIQQWFQLSSEIFDVIAWW